MKHKKKILVFTATYNEINNVEKLLLKIKKTRLNLDILILDDNSPDGTGEKLQSLEKKVGFPEAVINKDGKKIPFFKYGPKNNKIKDLPEDLKNKIEFELENEMKELGYI